MNRTPALGRKPEDWGRWRPTPDELLLVGAAIRPTDAALADWRAWRANRDPLRTEDGLVRLFPQVLHNLARAGLEPAEERLLKAAILPLAAKHRLAREGFERAAHALAGSGIPVLVLKGPALAAHYFPAAWCRPMNDVDLCVRDADLARAVAAVEQAGWALENPADLVRRELQHSATLRGAASAPIDLHWRLMSPCLYPGADDAAWARALPFGEGFPDGVRRLCAEDEFLLCCQHGARQNPTRPTRWLVDAAMILRGAGAGFDADRLFEEAGRRRLRMPVHHTVVLLARSLAVPEAAPLVPLAERCLPDWIENLGARVDAMPDARYAWELVRVVRYLRRVRGAGRIATPWGCLRELARDSKAGTVGGYLRETFRARVGR
jgi:hypothetical protein